MKHTAPSSLVLLAVACTTHAGPAPKVPEAREVTVAPADATSAGPDDEASQTETNAAPARLGAGTHEETEGDESLVGLIGTWRIEGSIHAAVSALSEDEAKEHTGKDIVITPTSLSSPWRKCERADWTHREEPLASWLTSWRAPTFDAGQKKLVGADDDSVTAWETPCGATPARVVQISGFRLAMLHDGVLFVAKPHPR